VDLECLLLAQSRHSRFLSCLVICFLGSVDNMRTQPLIITHNRTGNMKKIDTTYKTIRKGRQRYVYYPKTHMVNGSVTWNCRGSNVNSPSVSYPRNRQGCGCCFGETLRVGHFAKALRTKAKGILVFPYYFKSWFRVWCPLWQGGTSGKWENDGMSKAIGSASCA